MKVLWQWIERYGIPRALYTDDKNLYLADREPTIEEQLAGRHALTAFGKACHKLGIQIIPAASPQAKGRIERRHGVLQDRLVKELRLHGIKDLEAANELLGGGFVKTINEKFGHSPASAVDYHRRVPSGVRLEDVFVLEEQRTVQNDWTVAWDSRWFQITGPNAQTPSVPIWSIRSGYSSLRKCWATRMWRRLRYTPTGRLTSSRINTGLIHLSLI